MPAAQLPGGVGQSGLVEIAGPEPLQRGFELAVTSDAGKAQVACDRHRCPRASPCEETRADVRQRKPRYMADMAVSCLRCTPPDGLVRATTAGLLAHGNRGRCPDAASPAFPSLPAQWPTPRGGGRTSGSPLTVAGAAVDLPPDRKSSQDARRSLFTRSRGTVDT